jgi:aspartate aminotransferase-like enzyme
MSEGPEIFQKQYLMTAGPTPLPPRVAQVMAEDLLLSYIGDGEVTDAFNEIRRGHSS